MFRMGFWELVLIFAVVLLLFGGKRLPGIAAGLGEAIRNFKKAMSDNDATLPPAKPSSDETSKTISSSDNKQVH